MPGVDHPLAHEIAHGRQAVTLLLDDAEQLALGVELGEEPPAERQRLLPDVGAGQGVGLFERLAPRPWVRAYQRAMNPLFRWWCGLALGFAVTACSSPSRLRTR